MSRGKPRYTDRELMNRWAHAEMNAPLSTILATKGLDFSQANGCIGFFYVDHEEGVSLRVHALCRAEPGKTPAIVVDSTRIGEDGILRADEVGSFMLLSEEVANDLSVLEEQRWRIYHEPERLREIRTRFDLDQFRAPCYFDDVSVVLLSRERDHAEMVWVRLEEVSGDGTRFRGVLLNEPAADFGVHAGDTITVSFIEREEGRILVSEQGT